MSRSLLVVAGEISGDLHAARVLTSLRTRCPDLHCWGIGGDALRAAGMEIEVEVRDMAVLGLWEVLKRYFFFRRVLNETIRKIETRRPDAVLLVDYPGFNLRLARAAQQRGCKVFYFISPQVWAWHRARIPAMARIIDRLYVIFPFEVEVFATTGLRVEFVGHPLVDQARAALAEPLAPLPWEGAEDERIALLPGSRQQEIDRILPVQLAAAARLARANEQRCFIVAAASDEIADRIRMTIENTDVRLKRLHIVTNQTRQVLRQARAAMVASGTATIETALMGCPMIIIYKTAPLTYWFGKRLIRVPHLGMVNIVAGNTLCPEFLQHDACPSRMAATMETLLAETGERQRMIAGLSEIAGKLGCKDPGETVAESIEQELREIPDSTPEIEKNVCL